MTHVSLFSGIGGLDLAAEACGFTTVLMCERDSKCRLVLARHWPGVPIVEDVRELTGSIVRDACGGFPTLLSGGFPCQPFSSAGRRRGTDDDRHLWPEMRRVVRESRPRWVLGENVRGLLSIGNGTAFGAVLADLADLGYRVGWACFGADEAAGASHRRDRVFIVGYLADAGHGRGRRVGTHSQGRDCEAGRSVGAGQAPRPGPELADPASVRREGHGGREPGRQEGGRGVPKPGARGSIFPPGPGDLDGWRRVALSDPGLLPALSTEAEAELQVRPVADGVSRKVALKMLGNAVVPAQVLPILEWIAAWEATT